MLINEAVEIALSVQCSIRRASWEGTVEIGVTHKKEPMDLIIDEIEVNRYPNWDPTPEDLTADDWEITKA